MGQVSVVGTVWCQSHFSRAGLCSPAKAGLCSAGATALPLALSSLLAIPGVAELDKCPSFLLPAVLRLAGLSRRSPGGWPGTLGSVPAPWAACAAAHRLPAPAEGCPALQTAGLCLGKENCKCQHLSKVRKFHNPNRLFSS